MPTSQRIVVHDAAETLRDWCRTDEQGVLWLELPGGARYELVTSVFDPAIANHGDGSFHPFEAAEVEAAIAAVSYPLDGVAADVFILPYPRRAGLASAAGTGLILLSPGVYALPRTQQHAEVVHELGHVVQRADLPDTDTEAWSRYRGLRGITDPTVYSADAEHADRPHEIFAEDFRALFGGALATSTGTIENASLRAARRGARARGLHALAGRLAAGRHARRRAQSQPRRGRLLARRDPRRSRSTCSTWPGAVSPRCAPSPPATASAGAGTAATTSGRRVEPGVVFARTRDGSAAARVILLP